MALFKALSHHLPEGTEQTYKTPVSIAGPWPRFDTHTPPHTPQFQSTMANSALTFGVL
jgi:hypothetical protein